MRFGRPGFILLFGSRNIVSDDSAIAPVETICPQCHHEARIHGKVYRTWFTLFFLPLFPISSTRKFSQCSVCGSQFPVTLDELRQNLSSNEQRQNQEAITLYNSLRASPANAITLNQLMLMYAGMKEYGQAISAAKEFPDALNTSEQCMTTFGRVLLAAGEHDQAHHWFDNAIARNELLGEAHFYKAMAFVTTEPANYQRAIQAAKGARRANYPGAESLVRDLEAKLREQTEQQPT